MEVTAKVGASKPITAGDVAGWAGCGPGRASVPITAGTRRPCRERPGTRCAVRRRAGPRIPARRGERRSRKRAARRVNVHGWGRGGMPGGRGRAKKIERRGGFKRASMRCHSNPRKNEVVHSRCVGGRPPRTKSRRQRDLYTSAASHRGWREALACARWRRLRGGTRWAGIVARWPGSESAQWRADLGRNTARAGCHGRSRGPG